MYVCFPNTGSFNEIKMAKNDTMTHICLNDFIQKLFYKFWAVFFCWAKNLIQDYDAVQLITGETIPVENWVISEYI